MAKYIVEAGYVAGAGYKGQVLDESDFAEGEVKRLGTIPGSIRKLTDDEAKALDVPESDLTDGDGIAINSQGVNISPQAPPQPDGSGSDGVPAKGKKATTVTTGTDGGGFSL